MQGEDGRGESKEMSGQQVIMRSRVIIVDDVNKPAGRREVDQHSR